MRALITRPKEDSTTIAKQLEELGIESVIEPLMTVELVAEVKFDLDGVQAILLTSRNGARALASATASRHVVVYAVGDSTAELARELGFKSVESSSGDSESLAKLVRQRLNPDDGTLLHVVGNAVAGDIGGMLANDGFEVRRQELYTAHPVAALSVTTCGMLSNNAIDLALFFSPRTAQTFVDLIEQAELADACADMTAVCMSRAVALAVGSLKWREVHISGRPDLRSIIDIAASVNAEARQKEKNSHLIKEDALTDPPLLSSTSETSKNSQSWGAGAALPRSKRRSGFWVAGVTMIVVITVAGIFIWPLLSEGLGLRSDTTAVADSAVVASHSAQREMGVRVAAIEDALKSLRSGLLVQLKTASDVAVAELPRIAARLDAVEKTLAIKISEAGNGNVTAINARINVLEQSVIDLQSVLMARLDELNTRVSSDSLSAADGIIGTAWLRAETDRLMTSLTAMSRRLESLESAASRPALSPEPVQGSALVLAVGQLREALNKSGPFSATLNSVRVVGGADPLIVSELEVLAPLAATGVATKNRLIAMFDVAAAEAARAAIAPEGSGWIDRTVQRLASVVTIRREGANVEGNSAQAILARAEARLVARDLEGADKALAALTGAPAAAMAVWRNELAARISAEGALDRLNHHAIQLLSGAS